MQLLNGLPLEYDAVVASIEIEEIQSLLLNQEMRIQQAATEVTPVANVADNTGQQKKSDGSSPGRGGQTNNRGGFNNRGRGKGGGRNGGWNNSSRPICQICGKPGHVAAKCYHRFDQTFQGTQNNNAYSASPDSVGNSEWLIDSGATNHITADQSNVSQKNEYHGGERLVISNGQGCTLIILDLLGLNHLVAIFG